MAVAARRSVCMRPFPALFVCPLDIFDVSCKDVVMACWDAKGITGQRYSMPKLQWGFEDDSDLGMRMLCDVVPGC